MSFIFSLVLPCSIFFFVLWRVYKFQKNRHFYESIPGPPTVPILGNALDFTSTTELLSTFSRYARNYGGIVKIQLGPVHKAILVTDQKFLECVLTSTELLKKSKDYKFAGTWLGTGLLTGYGPKWKTHRRILNPAFHYQMLENFIDVFESCGTVLINKLEQEVGGGGIDIHPLVTLCTLDIICESTMGISINAQNDGNSDYVRSVKDMCKIIIERSMSAITQRYDLFYILTQNYCTQRKALRILHAQAHSVITQKKKDLETKIRKDYNKSENTKTRKAFLDLLLEATVEGQPLSEEEIREEVDTFMFAGHDTTAAAISFTLFCLANYQDVQKKAFDEEEVLFGSAKNPCVTYADLQNMKYLEQVIKESLRLYPPVPIYCRQSSDNVIYNNRRLPKEDTIIIFTYGIHRNPEYFEDPEIFNPDRFENTDAKLTYAYIPFSVGPRNCIGQKFAMLEMKSTISKILRNFKLRPAVPEHKLKLAAETVLTSLNGIKIGLESRS